MKILFLVCGPPGSGKSTLASALANLAETGAAFLSRPMTISSTPKGPTSSAVTVSASRIPFVSSMQKVQ